jgi:branched-chain amino acid aminotransferase group I
MEEIVFLNGAFLPVGKAAISINDYGFLYGCGIFETMRAYNGKVFRLDAHLDRLKESADRLGIPVQVASLIEQIDDTIRINRLAEARVRVYLTSGEGTAAPDIRSCQNPTLLIKAVPYTPILADVYERGFRVMISTFHRCSRSVMSGLKTANYLENLLVRKEAADSGFDDAVLLNDKGNVAEASSSNLFIVSGDILKTPNLQSGILPGITRAVVLEQAAGFGLKALEADIDPTELLSAGEVFLTNSVMELMPVTMEGDKSIGGGRPGVVTRNLMAAYRAEVLLETR